MRIPTTYFGHAELKYLHITTSRGLTGHVKHCHSARQTIALVANAHIAIVLYIYSITAYSMNTHYGHLNMPCHSAVQTTLYNTLTITQI